MGTKLLEGARKWRGSSEYYFIIEVLKVVGVPFWLVWFSHSETLNS
jgi:hypothetical protein